VFNEINARRINDELNVFQALQTSPIFLAVIAITVGLQVSGQRPAAGRLHPTRRLPAATAQPQHGCCTHPHPTPASSLPRPPQAIIMQTGMGLFFKVVPLNGAEWGISIAIGATAIPVSVVTRVLGAFVPTVRRRRKGRRTLSTGRAPGGARVGIEAVQRRASMQPDRGGGAVPGVARDNPRAVPRLSGLASIGPSGGALG
jgi:hypothetical protein